MGKPKQGIRYYKDSNNRVYAKLSGCEDDAIRMFEKWSGRKLVLDCECFKMQNEYVGSVKCDERDEFDYEKGKQIAKMRLLEKYDRDFRRVVNNLSNVAFLIDEVIKQADDYDSRRWSLSYQRKKDLEGKKGTEETK